MKKVVSVVIAFLMTLGMATTALAEDGSFIDKETAIINEYELVKELAEYTTETLAESGFDSKQIAQIKNYKDVYQEEITSLNTLSDDVLKKNGYSEEQISTIRSFSGSEEEMSALSATLTLDVFTSAFRFDGTYTRGTLFYSWSWQSIPFFKMQDMVAVSWNDWIVTNEYSVVNYYNVNTGASYINKSAVFSQDGNGTIGAGHKFDVSLSDNYYYAKKGSGQFTVRSSEHIGKDISYLVEYGHSELMPHINFSVGIGGAEGSISFSVGTVTAGSYKDSKIATE